MRLRAWAALGLLVGMVLSGCGASPNAPTTQPKAVLGEPFDLHIGQTAVLSPDNIQVTFTGVSEDSRCPTGVQCAWAGQAVIAIKVSPSGGGQGDALLTLGSPKAGLDEASFGLYVVKVQALQPQPVADVKTDPGEYAATLVITKK